MCHLGACSLRGSSIAGPGKAWSALEQGQYLFELAERKPNFIKVPVALMDGIIGFLDFLAKIFPGLEVRPHLTMPLTEPGKSSACTGRVAAPAKEADALRS